MERYPLRRTLRGRRAFAAGFFPLVGRERALCEISRRFPSQPRCMTSAQATLCRLAPAVSRPLRKPWKKCIAVGRAYDLLRQDHHDHLKWIQKEVGFSY